MAKPYSVDILVYCEDSLETTKRCIESLMKHTPKSCNIMFLGDCLSTETAKYLIRLCRVSKKSGTISFLNSCVKLGYSKNIARGIATTHSSYIVAIDSNVIVYAGWIANLHKCLMSEASLGVVCPFTNVGKKQAVWNGDTGHTREVIADIIAKISEMKYPRITSADVCIMFKRIVVQKILGSERKRFVTNEKLCHDARQLGFGVALADDVFVWYQGIKRSKFIGDDSQFFKNDPLIGFKKTLSSALKTVNPLKAICIPVKEKKDVQSGKTLPIRILQLKDIGVDFKIRKVERARKHTRKAGLDVIIPVSNVCGLDFKDRLEGLNTLLNDFLNLQTQVNLHVILVEQIVDDAHDTYSKHVDVPSDMHYTAVTVEHPVFVKTWLYNVGVKHTIYSQFIICESEVVANQDYLRDLIEFVKERELKWCFGWDKIVYLSNKAKEEYLQTGKIIICKCPNRCRGWCCRYDQDGGIYPYKMPVSGGAEGGIVYFNKKFWTTELNGASELFRELGGNDNEIILRAKSITQTYESYPMSLFHMWHPISGVKFGKYKEVNRRLLYWMREDENYKAMCQFLADQRLGELDGPLDIDGCLVRGQTAQMVKRAYQAISKVYLKCD